MWDAVGYCRMLCLQYRAHVIGKGGWWVGVWQMWMKICGKDEKLFSFKIVVWLSGTRAGRLNLRLSVRLKVKRQALQ